MTWNLKSSEFGSSIWILLFPLNMPMHPRCDLAVTSDSVAIGLTAPRRLCRGEEQRPCEPLRLICPGGASSPELWLPNQLARRPFPHGFSAEWLSEEEEELPNRDPCRPAAGSMPRYRLAFLSWAAAAADFPSFSTQEWKPKKLPRCTPLASPGILPSLVSLVLKPVMFNIMLVCVFYDDFFL